jgi:hypothetical protein
MDNTRDHISGIRFQTRKTQKSLQVNYLTDGNVCPILESHVNNYQDLVSRKVVK